MTRFTDSEAFWPYYLGEHRNPLCRILHFIGTTGFLSSIGAGLVANPVGMGVSLLLAAALLVPGSMYVEARRAAFLPLIGGAVILALGSPYVLGGIVFAYFFAWIGHFRVEGNRPATFTYPVWSLQSDLRMWARMLRGELWSGDTVPAES